MNIDEVIDKIKKAVRLANRTTETGERETAMRLAKALADRNGIALDEIEAGESAPDKAVIEDDAEYRYWDGCEIGYAFYILEQHFGVIVIQTPLRHNRAKKRSSWIGSPLNIDIARHVLHILLRECRKAYRDEQLTIDSRSIILRDTLKRWGYHPSIVRNEVALFKRKSISRRDFMAGFFCTIDKKLTEHPLRNDIAADCERAKRKFDEYRANNAVREVKARSKKNVSAETFYAGANAAKGVNLARPCHGEGNSPLALGTVA